tara:strand:+ start:78 stop:512 length:435 start_codon:yes stop_codon:yes gene_type:complete
MPTTFTNNWKNILDKLRNIIRNEFKGALPVYIGDEGNEGSQYLRLDPVGSDFIEYMHSSESREFTISVFYYFAEHNIKKTALDNVLRYVSRIEALIHDNVTMTLADSTQAYNCRFESTEINPDQESGVYVVQWEYKCQHTGNIS